MAERPIVCAQEMIDMEVDLDQYNLHPDPHFHMGNVVDLSQPNAHQLPPASESSANTATNQFMDFIGTNPFYGNQHSNNGHQYRHPNEDVDVGHVIHSRFSLNPHMASSSSRVFSFPINGSACQMPSSSNQHVPLEVSMDGQYCRGNQFNDNSRGLGKRKNAGEIIGNSNCGSGLVNSTSASLNLSLNSGIQHWNRSYESRPHMPDVRYCTSSNEPLGGSFRIQEASQRNMRNQANMVYLQQESSLSDHQNRSFQVNYMDQSLQPGGNQWPEQYRSSVVDGAGPNWNHAHVAASMLGRSSFGGSLETGHTASFGYRDPTTNQNYMAMPQAMPHQQHLPSLQGVRGHCHSRQTITAPPFGYPLNNSLHLGSINPFMSGAESGPRFSRPIPSIASEQIHRRPRNVVYPAPGHNAAMMDSLSPEDIAFLEFTGYYGVASLIDQHREMRLDIDNMSYEELLALQEQIGDVSTGLSEESIMNHLKTRMYPPSTAISLSIQTSSISLDSGACIICQVDFEENERIGILDCGHDYHADCIKQWLLIKNLCPICKATGLAVHRTKQER